jgi:hypothetical protein
MTAPLDRRLWRLEQRDQGVACTCPLRPPIVLCGCSARHRALPREDHGECRPLNWVLRRETSALLREPCADYRSRHTWRNLQA